MATNSTRAAGDARPQAPQAGSELLSYLMARAAQHLPTWLEQQIDAGSRGSARGPERLADQAPQAIALGRRSQRAGQHYPETIAVQPVLENQHQEQAPVQAPAVAQQPLEVLRRVEAIRGAQARPGQGTYAASRLRPFCRRRFSTRRPPWLPIRTRKPWVRLRRRLLG
jgi:hypothetical protein